MTANFSSRSGRLYNLRKKIHGLSEMEAAQKLGLARMTYKGYESVDRRHIPPEVLKKMAELFKTTVEYIQFGLGSGPVASFIGGVVDHAKEFSEGIRELTKEEKKRLESEYQAQKESVKAALRVTEANRNKLKAEIEFLEMKLEELKKGGK